MVPENLRIPVYAEGFQINGRKWRLLCERTTGKFLTGHYNDKYSDILMALYPQTVFYCSVFFFMQENELFICTINKNITSRMYLLRAFI